ncbi:MAG: carboxypeptidase-like regulatory domain-containing protein, partial [Bacteroidales bacterium]
MKNESNYLRHLFSLFLFFVICSTAFAQNMIKGTVTDAADKSPLPGVSIAISGTTEGTITDADGNYSLKAKRGETLVFSMVGYKPQKITISSNMINVALQQDNQQID